jgi:hypothetical protein
MPFTTIGYIANEGHANTPRRRAQERLRDELEQLVGAAAEHELLLRDREPLRERRAQIEAGAVRDSGGTLASASRTAAIARGDGPIGLSFDASLIAPSMPSSRSSSSGGLPGS